MTKRDDCSVKICRAHTLALNSLQMHDSQDIVFRKLSVVVVVVYRMVRQTQGEEAAIQILDVLNWNYHLNI
jgi:hypothetical protein